jgi:ABC-type dipeptide/oligopeptide/nickel transport system permease subunit
LIAGVVILLLMALFAICAPLFGDPNYQDYAHGLTASGLPLSPGNKPYLFGTDTLGRNMLPRMAFGMRTSLTVAVVVSVTTLMLSLLIAVAAGFYRGVLESILMRVTDVFLVIPNLQVALVLAVLIPGAIFRIVMITTILSWAYPARLFYSEALRLRRRGFVESSEAIGVRGSTILFRHMIPYLLPLALTYAPWAAAGAIGFEAGLSFIGAGINPPAASLGKMMADNEGALSYAPHLLLEPAILLLLVTIAFLLIAEGMKVRNPDVSRDSWLGD